MFILLPSAYGLRALRAARRAEGGYNGLWPCCKLLPGLAFPLKTGPIVVKIHPQRGAYNLQGQTVRRARGSTARPFLLQPAPHTHRERVARRARTSSEGLALVTGHEDAPFENNADNGRRDLKRPPSRHRPSSVLASSIPDAGLFVKPQASSKSSNVSDELAVMQAPWASSPGCAQRLHSGIPRAWQLPCSTEFELLLLGFCAPLQ
ncbi:hypothetical protein BV20DRAFT_1051801 [Pilatotrama ljubarskyi]|nr:hypothetical protein BV20DRAFT_1051801 [Pilatotrama ljubarskyi]